MLKALLKVKKNNQYCKKKTKKQQQVNGQVLISGLAENTTGSHTSILQKVNNNRQL